jgi:hypothetical protein
VGNSKPLFTYHYDAGEGKWFETRFYRGHFVMTGDDPKFSANYIRAIPYRSVQSTEIPVFKDSPGKTFIKLEVGQVEYMIHGPSPVIYAIGEWLWDLISSSGKSDADIPPLPKVLEEINVPSCTRCGTALKPGAAFCGKCGEPNKQD